MNNGTHVVCNKEADIAVIKSDVAGIKIDVSAIRNSILGNGHPGLTTRTANLEQTVKAGVWLAGVVVVAIIGLFVDMIRR